MLFDNNYDSSKRAHAHTHTHTPKPESLLVFSFFFFFTRETIDFDVKQIIIITVYTRNRLLCLLYSRVRLIFLIILILCKRQRRAHRDYGHAISYRGSQSPCRKRMCKKKKLTTNKNKTIAATIATAAAVVLLPFDCNIRVQNSSVTTKSNEKKNIYV